MAKSVINANDQDETKKEIPCMSNSLKTDTENAIR